MAVLCGPLKGVLFEYLNAISWYYIEHCMAVLFYICSLENDEENCLKNGEQGRELKVLLCLRPRVTFNNKTSPA